MDKSIANSTSWIRLLALLHKKETETVSQIKYAYDDSTIK